MTLPLLFCLVVLLGATLVLCCVLLGARTRSPFKRTPTNHDLARELLRKTIVRVHP